MKIFILSLLVAVSSCSFKKSQLENQTQNGHNELYSEPAEPKEIESTHKRIVIAATNDIHGHYQANLVTFKDKHAGKQSIKVGGVDYISSYLKILRSKFENVLLVDSGDIFSNKAQEMNYVQEFYKTLDYDAITVGLKDFNLKLPSKYHSSSDFFKDFSAKSKTPVILSNLYELKTARVVEWPGTLPYLMKEIDGIKVGIIGLIPDDVVGQTPVDNRVGLYVESMLQSTLRHARLLRSLGSELIVVLTHQGLNCGDEIAQEMKLPPSKVNFEPEKPGVCDLSNKMGEFLTRLPPNLVDVVIGGRTHQKIANYVNTTLVMSTFEDGQSFSYAEFFFDSKTKKVSKDMTVVHQPVMFCQEFFKETNDCYTEDPSVDHKVRAPAKFLGQIIEPDAGLEQKFHYFLKAQPTTGSSILKSIQSILDFHEGDISFYRSDSNHSKLMMLTLKGKELIQVLENDFNQGQEKNWQPSPFRLHDTSLTITIKGELIEAQTDYKILASIEDLQNHPGLKKHIASAETKSLNYVSWNEPGIEKDDVSTAMAASDTVR